MTEERKCIYCGSFRRISVSCCSQCYEKIVLIRRIREIGTKIKMQAAKERLEKDMKGDDAR